MLADEQVEVGVVRHPVALVREAHLDDATSAGVYLRRTSPGMSEKRRKCSFGADRPLHVKPVATRSTCDPCSTSSKIASDFARCRGPSRCSSPCPFRQGMISECLGDSNTRPACARSAARAASSGNCTVRHAGRRGACTPAPRRRASLRRHARYSTRPRASRRYDGVTCARSRDRCPGGRSPRAGAAAPPASRRESRHGSASRLNRKSRAVGEALKMDRVQAREGRRRREDSEFEQELSRDSPVRANARSTSARNYRPGTPRPTCTAVLRP